MSKSARDRTEAPLREPRNRLGERYGTLLAGTNRAWGDLKNAFSDTCSAVEEDASAN